MSEKAAKRRGRPPKPAKERRRGNVTFRVRDRLKAQLKQAAILNQRSLSEEIECRLERSFSFDHVSEERSVDPRLAGEVMTGEDADSPPMIWADIESAENALNVQTFLARWSMPDGGYRFAFCTIGEDGDHYLLDSTEFAQPVWRSAREPDQILVPSVVSRAALEVLHERRRHITEEGWSSGHDDRHTDESLAMAAALYASPRDDLRIVDQREHGVFFHDPWPWFAGSAWDKRKKHDRRRRLVIAGALILAELDRLDRRAALARAKVKVPGDYPTVQSAVDAIVEKPCDVE